MLPKSFGASSLLLRQSEAENVGDPFKGEQDAGTAVFDRSASMYEALRYVMFYSGTLSFAHFELRALH